jgi:hypothetical protein
MLDSNFNFSIVDGQQAAAAKRKEDDTTAAAQAAAATAHRKQEALVVVMAAAHKTLDEAWVSERAAALAWEKRRPSLVTRNSSSPLPKGLCFPRMTTTTAPSTSAPTPTPPSPRTCMRRLLASRTYDRWSRSFWNPHHPTTSGGMTSCFSRFIATPSMIMSSLTSPIRPSIGLDWTRGDLNPQHPLPRARRDHLGADGVRTPGMACDRGLVPWQQ